MATHMATHMAARFVPSSLRKPHWVLLGREAAVKRAPGTLHRHTLLGNPLVVFTTDAPDAELHVMDDACPHRGASLSRGAVRDACVVCPGHGMAFGPSTSPARAYDYAILQGLVWVDLGKDLLSQHGMPPTLPEFSSHDFSATGYTLELGGGVNAVLLLEALLSSGGDAADGATVDTRFEAPFTFVRRVGVDGRVVLALMISLQPISRSRLLAHVHFARPAGEDDHATFRAATELLVRSHAALARTVDPARWTTNHLVEADALVARYREEMTRVFPDILSYFVPPTERAS